MKTRLLLAIMIGKLVRRASRLTGRGGSALPGLIIEKLMPNFLDAVLSKLPDGVIAVVGTNGKTTTTKIITELLTAQDKKVLTNRTGSNFTRGIIAAIVNEYSLRDRSLGKDIAVLELDEAYGKLFVEKVKPDYVVALNVMRDQLDRYGELEFTSKLLASILQAATKGCVINADAPELVAIGEQLAVPVTYYGVNPKLRHLFPTDAELLSMAVKADHQRHKALAVELVNFDDQTINYKLRNQIYSSRLQLKGQYNYHNAAAALAIVSLVLPKISPQDWIDSLTAVEPAFGRGEIVRVGDQSVEIMLVKNPSSFRQMLASHDDEALTMIAINDKPADGRDVSWLWDVDFTKYSSPIYMVSGIRANDLALRLQYDGLKPDKVTTDLAEAIKQLLAASSTLPRRIFCTYTAMLAIRSKINKLTALKPGL